MRIGQVNQDNYMEFMKMFGGNKSKSLENLLGKGENNKYAKTQEEEIAMLVKAGYIEEGMHVREGDTSYRKIVPVSDGVKDKLIEAARRHFLTNGKGGAEARDGDEIGAIMKEYRKDIPPSERLSVTWTLGQIVQQENSRMLEYVRANVPGWQAGEVIPSDVLKAAVSGNHVDIKA